MVAIKAQQAERFTASPDAAYSAVLIYGADPGLVLERAQKIARAVAGRETPASEILSLSDADLEDEPDRIGIELQTVAMFSGRKVVRAAAGRRITGALLKPLIEASALEGFLIVEAGNLKPDDSLRALFDKAPRAASIACYLDDSADLDALVSDVLRAFKLTITADARELLTSRLGADRAQSRGEIEKLALYAGDRREITAEDVEAIVGDAIELTVDRVAVATANGDSAQASAHFARLLAAGESPQTIILGLQRYFLRLHRIRSDTDAGRPLDDVLRSLRPPLHFKQRDAIARQARAWAAGPLSAAIEGITEAVKSSRLLPALDNAIAERLMLRLAWLASRGRGHDQSSTAATRRR